jgi:Rod binding domain-containing protein
MRAESVTAVPIQSRSESRPADEANEAAAKAFEAVFVCEMLAHTGFEKALSSQSGFGGEAMSGFLLEALSQKLVDRGGFGIAGMITGDLDKETADAI